MAIGFDVAANWDSNGTSATTASVHATIGSNANRAIVVNLGTSASASKSPVVTYSGTSDSINNLGSIIGNGGTGALYEYLILNPQSGAQSVTITLNASDAFRRLSISAYSGVQQSVPIDNISSIINNSASSITGVVTVNTTNSWVVMGVTNGNGQTPAAAGGDVVRTANSGGIAIADLNADQSTGSKSIAVTGTAGNAWGAITMSLAPAVSAVVSSSPLTLLGAG